MGMGREAITPMMTCRTSGGGDHMRKYIHTHVMTCRTSGGGGHMCKYIHTHVMTCRTRR